MSLSQKQLRRNIAELSGHGHRFYIDSIDLLVPNSDRLMPNNSEFLMYSTEVTTRGL